MKKILVPTDFSECASYAVQVAMVIADKTRASLHFLHIMPNPNEDYHVPHTPGVSIRSTQKISAQNHLNVLVTKATHAGLEASPILVFDKGNERIEHFIEPLEIDLIVMGSHGISGIRELVIGSNTQRVVRHSPVPVLVVKYPKEKDFAIKNIIYASTFLGDDQHALALITSFATLWKARVNILCIRVKGMTNEKIDPDKAIRELKEKYPTVHFMVNHIEADDEEWGIHQFARLIEADLIALNMEDIKGSLFRRQVAEELVNHEQTPVMVFSRQYSKAEV